VRPPVKGCDTDAKRSRDEPFVPTLRARHVSAMVMAGCALRRLAWICFPLGIEPGRTRLPGLVSVARAGTIAEGARRILCHALPRSVGGQ
jgi:hypothetical protein